MPFNDYDLLCEYEQGEMDRLRLLDCLDIPYAKSSEYFFSSKVHKNRTFKMGQPNMMPHNDYTTCAVDVTKEAMCYDPQ